MSNKLDPVIVVDHVSKDFVLPHEKVGSVKSVFTGLLRKHTGRSTRQRALQDIDLKVYPGEFFGIVGRNGSGKSTLLKMLAGIYQPTKGRVHTYGKLVPFIELGVGFNPELTGRENVYLNGAMLGFSEKEVDKMYQSIVEFAELEKFMDQKLKNYSSGMQVRLAFSMAIRAEADILLIDEVLAVGDADFQRKCFKYFNKLKQQKRTVVFVSHDMDAIREYCTRAVLIDKSRLIEEGAANDVATQYLKIMNSGMLQSSDESLKGDRWGDGTCKISKVSCDTTDKKITLTYEAEAIRDCLDPVYGYRIRNDKGEEICGNNNLILNKRALPLYKNNRLRLMWEIDNVLGDGVHYVDVAVVYEGAHTVADWWDAAVVLEIVRERRTHYPVNPRTKVLMEGVEYTAL